MKNPFRRVEKRLGEVGRFLDDQLTTPNSELRTVLAQVVRSEAKNFFALRVGLEIEQFERELAARAARTLTELGSAAPSLDQHAADAVALTVDAAPSTLPTCSADKPCNLPGHEVSIDPTKAVNVMDLCPNTRFRISEEEG